MLENYVRNMYNIIEIVDMAAAGRQGKVKNMNQITEEIKAAMLESEKAAAVLELLIESIEGSDIPSQKVLLPALDVVRDYVVQINDCLIVADRAGSEAQEG